LKHLKFETGVGLGLFIVKNAIDKLGGTINVKNKHNEGTTFEIVLPSTATE